MNSWARARRAASDGPDDGYGDVFLVVDGWSTLRAEFDALEGELQVLAQRALTFGVHLLTSATRWMDYRTGIRDLLGTRYELRLGDAMDSEIDRKLVANIPMDRPGRGVTTQKSTSSPRCPVSTQMPAPARSAAEWPTSSRQ